MFLEINRLFQKKKKNGIAQTFYSCMYATSYFLEKLANLLKIKGKFFDLLKPKSYLNRPKSYLWKT